MEVQIEDFIKYINDSRDHFLKNLTDLKDDQWDWKPYDECKSIRQILAHLVSDDRAFLYIFETGKIPDYDSLQEQETDIDCLLALLAKTRDELISYIRVRFSDTPLDTEIMTFMGPEKLAIALMAITSEDHYHVGQVAFIRMASDPKWDFYASIYGGG